MADENKVSHPEIKLYIHEHLSPWGERIGRMEEILARHDKDIEDIGTKMDHLDVKIGEGHETVINTITKCRDSMVEDIKSQGKEITMVKNWLRSLFLAGIGLTAIVSALNHFGVIGGQ